MKFQLLIETKILKNKDFLALNHSYSVFFIFILLINVKMPKVGILTFMSRINSMLSRAEHDFLRTSRPDSPKTKSYKNGTRKGMKYNISWPIIL